MSILSLGHACIKSPNLEQTEAFYCGALGLKMHFRFMREGRVIGLYMKAENNTFVEVFHADEFDNTKLRCLNHFCLETDNLQALHQRLVDKGFTPGKIKMGCDKSWQFWMDDPHGLPIEFQEYTPESAQYSGKDVEVDW